MENKSNQRFEAIDSFNKKVLKMRNKENKKNKNNTKGRKKERKTMLQDLFFMGLQYIHCCSLKLI